MDVGEWLAQELRARRVKQSDVERVTGIPASFLSKQIAGIRELRASELRLILAMFGYPDPLSPVGAEEAAALALFRSLDPESRNAVMALLRAMPRRSAGNSGSTSENASTMAK